MQDLSKKVSFYFLITGIIFTILGAFGVVKPIYFSIYLVQILAIFFLISGVKNVYKSNELRKLGFDFGGFLFVSIVEILFAISLFVTPFSSQIFLVIYSGIFILVKGIFMLFRTKKSNELSECSIGNAVIDILFGALLILMPVFAGEIIALCIAWYFIFIGVEFIVSGYQLNKKS